MKAMEILRLPAYTRNVWGATITIFKIIFAFLPYLMEIVSCAKFFLPLLILFMCVHDRISTHSYQFLLNSSCMKFDDERVVKSH